MSVNIISGVYKVKYLDGSWYCFRTSSAAADINPEDDVLLIRTTPSTATITDWEWVSFTQLHAREYEQSNRLKLENLIDNNELREFKRLIAKWNKWVENHPGTSLIHINIS